MENKLLYSNDNFCFLLALQIILKPSDLSERFKRKQCFVFYSKNLKKKLYFIINVTVPNSIFIPLKIWNVFVEKRKMWTI